MEITSPLSVFDIRTKLAEAIDTSLPWWLANSAVAAWIGHKVFGRETADGFQIVRPDVWNSPYRPSLSITLSPSARGTVLSLVFFGYGVLGWPLMFVMVTTVSIVAFPYGQWEIVELLWIVFPIGAAGMHVLCWFGYVREKKALIFWLNSILAT